ncbi:hypothetical protein N9289_01525, partial [Candidatus Poseidonia sp.]|nr:hypothetical protein [Poseidonia sp.]
MADDEWEEEFLKQLEAMFTKMGLPFNKEQLRGFLKQFRDQFEAMGINPEKIAKGEVNFNFDISEISK